MSRKKRFEKPADMQKAIDKYLDGNDKPTICGMARALGCVRQTLLNYEGDEAFKHIVRDAKVRIEEKVEEQLLYGDGRPTGAIFWLKSNCGWIETQHIEITGKDGGPVETKSEINNKLKQIQDAKKRINSD